MTLHLTEARQSFLARAAATGYRGGVLFHAEGTMVNIYGGLWFESLVAQDAHFALQAQLFERGVIQGIQMRVAHPSFTPGVTAEDLSAICARLPSGMPVFVHFGAENCGVDFGETFDECGAFEQRGVAAGKMWSQWNAETIAWGKRVAGVTQRPPGLPIGVVHAGYAHTEDLLTDVSGARHRAMDALRSYDDGAQIAVENVPAFVHCDWYDALTGANYSWGRAHYWGIGGTPHDMGATLAMLGPRWRTLIDFTHLFVTRNQAAHAWGPFRPQFRQYFQEGEAVIERMVADALVLPHWPICHFSGIPPTLMDASDCMDAPVVGPIRDALRTMEVVCLEMPWRAWSAERIVADFRQRYLE